jgi:hypothetical protein
MLAAAVVAFNPQFLFTSALVTNDMLLTALSAGLFWLCIATTAAGATVGNRAIGNTSFGRPIVNRQLVIVNVLAGVLFGLALLTKQSALLLGPLLLWWGWTISGGNWRRVALHTALWLGTALLVAGWWYVRNWQLYGDLLGLADFRASYATQPFDWRSWSAWGSALAQLYGSFWARFGWLSLHPPAWVLWCSGVLVWLALAGGGHLLPPSSAGPLSPADEARGFRSLWTPMYMLPLLALAWVVSFALVAGLVAWQGRFLFPALPAIALLLAAGLTGFRVHRLDGRGWGVIPGLLFLLALYMPYGVIAPAYEWRVLPPVVAQQRIERPAYARYAKEWERGVELRGWRVSHAQENGLPNPIRPGEGVRAGQTISITLTWHALERVPPDRNWTVFLHLVDDAGEIVTEHNSIPQGGQMPMPLWTPGDWLEDTHPLVIPADLPAGAYTLRVGLYRPWQRDPRKGHRQEVWNAQGEHIGDYAEVGTLRVRQANP